MKVGVQLIFQNAFEGMSDEEMFLSEAKLAELYEPLGYDAVWSVFRSQIDIRRQTH